MINLRSWIDPRLYTLTVDNVRSYMLSHGWRLQDDPRGTLLIFEGPTDDFGQAAILTLPVSEKMADYRLRLEDLVSALGIIENRYAVDVLNDMLTSHATSNGTPPAPVSGTEQPAASH
jgi:hypothetical protein